MLTRDVRPYTEEDRGRKSLAAGVLIYIREKPQIGNVGYDGTSKDASVIMVSSGNEGIYLQKNDVIVIFGVL